MGEENNGEENHNKRCGKRGRRIHYYCVPCPFGTGGIKAGDKGLGNCYCKKDAVYTRLERTKPKISRNRNVGFFYLFHRRTLWCAGGCHVSGMQDFKGQKHCMVSSGNDRRQINLEMPGMLFIFFQGNTMI